MNEIISNINAWIPTVTSIIAVVVTVLNSCSKLKNMMSNAKTALSELKNDKTFRECVTELKMLSAENRELNRRVALLTDRIAKIEGYSDMVGGANDGQTD